MTEPIPLTGTDLEIAHRITAGQPPAHIEHVGWFRSAWSPADVRRVARRLALYALYRKEQRAREVPERVPRVRKECGTTIGHARHQKRKERICDECRTARREYKQSLEKKKPAGKPGPKPLPREHGTARGYYQHRTYGEPKCEPCKAARRTPPEQRKPKTKKPKTKPARVRGEDTMETCCAFRLKSVAMAEADLHTAAIRAAAHPTPRTLATLEVRKVNAEEARENFEQHIAGCTAGAA